MLHPELKKENVTIRLPKWKHRKITEEAAKKEHTSVSSIMEDGLDKIHPWKPPTKKELEEK